MGVLAECNQYLIVVPPRVLPLKQHMAYPHTPGPPIHYNKDNILYSGFYWRCFILAIEIKDNLAKLNLTNDIAFERNLANGEGLRMHK